MPRTLLILSTILLTSCTYRWSDTAADGTPLSVAEPQCRAKARASADRQLPLPFMYDRGPADFPPDSRQDIENRETALCLQNKGFTHVKE